MKAATRGRNRVFRGAHTLPSVVASPESGHAGESGIRTDSPQGARPPSIRQTMTANGSTSIDRTRRRIGVGAAAAAAGLLAGCDLSPGTDHTGDTAPRSAPWIASRGLPPRPLALVLSSGGPRGFVHAGVLKALDEIGVVPDMIVGASVGALTGALYAGGLSGERIVELALDAGVLDLVAMTMGSGERWSGRPLARWVNDRLDGRGLAALPIRCAAVAVRVTDGTVTAFTDGDAGVAVQASCAIVGLFRPVSIRGDQFVDPDLTMPMPVRIARRLGAARVLSIDASAHEDRAPGGADRYREGDLRKRALTLPDTEASDVNLHPDFGYWVSLKREFRERAIDAGYRETLAAADRIRALAADAHLRAPVTRGASGTGA